MNAPAKKKTIEEAPEPLPTTPENAPEALLELPIPHAYALIPVPNRPGRFWAVHLRNVTAVGLDHLEPSGRSEAAAYGLQRIGRAMDRRHKEKQWNT